MNKDLAQLLAVARLWGALGKAQSAQFPLIRPELLAEVAQHMPL